MATVPILQPQAAPEALRVAPQNFSIPDNSGIGRAMSGLGQQLQQTGMAVIDKIDGTAVDAARAQANTQLNALQADLLRRRGMQASTSMQDFQTGVTKMREEITKDLNPLQRQMFDKAFTPSLTGAEYDVRTHSQKQLDAAEIDAKVALAQSHGTAYTAGSEKERAYNRAQMEKALNEVADRQGMMPESRTVFLQRQIFDLHSNTVTSLQEQGKLKEAADYLAQYKSEMDPKVHSKAAAQVAKDQNLVTVQGFVDGLQVGTLRGDYAAQRAEAEKKLTGEQRDMAVKRIDDLAQRDKAAQEKAEDEGLRRYTADLADNVDMSQLTSAQFSKKYPGEKALATWAKEKVAVRKQETKTATARVAGKELDLLVLNYDPQAPLSVQNPLKERFLDLYHEVKNSDPDFAAGALTMFNNKLAESRSLSPALAYELTSPKSNLAERIREDVDRIATSGRNALDEDQISVLATELLSQVWRAHKQHPEWNQSPAKALGYYEELILPTLVKKELPQMLARLKKGPQTPFTPGTILNQRQTNAPAPRYTFDISSDDEATAQNVRGVMLTKPKQ